MGIFEADRATALETSGRITITGMKQSLLTMRYPEWMLLPRHWI